jgi:hypothetical protein
MLDDEVVSTRPFAVQLLGTEQFLHVHRGRNNLPDGRLTWVEKDAATWFETRDGAERYRRKLIGENAVIFDGRTFR